MMTTSNWQDEVLATFGGPRAGRSKASEVQTMDSVNANKNVNKLAVTEKPEIIVCGTVDKPYFEIKYHEVGKPDVNVGFGSYNIENVFKWLENEFVVVEAEERKTPDMVREPQHYQHGTFEVIDEMIIVFGVEATIQFCRMNAWKYRARAPYKGKMEQDMDKANRYLEMAYEMSQIRQEHPEADGYEVVFLLKGRIEREGESDGSGK